MNRYINLWDLPTVDDLYLIAGWKQWADAGAISSGLPKYLIEQTQAKKIGEMRSESFYLFQLPGTQDLFRPRITLKEGYRQRLEKPKNEFYYWDNGDKGVIIFLGEEPHLNVDRYTQALCDLVYTLGINQVAAVGGIYGAMPYDKDRAVMCAYSMPNLKDKLQPYAVTFSDYRGGPSIGTFLLDQTDKAMIDYFVLYGFVPAYDFSQRAIQLRVISLDEDYKAWLDLLRRLVHLFKLDFDFTDLEKRSAASLAAMAEKIEAVKRKVPQLDVTGYLDKISQDFQEPSFAPLDDVWDEAFQDLFDDEDEA